MVNKIIKEFKRNEGERNVNEMQDDRNIYKCQKTREKKA